MAWTYTDWNNLLKGLWEITNFYKTKVQTKTLIKTLILTEAAFSLGSQLHWLQVWQNSESTYVMEPSYHHYIRDKIR